MTRTIEHAVTSEDLQHLMQGEGGVDLERVVEHGRQVAMRVVGVQAGTTAARLGAQNGDTIETINGPRLDSIAAAYRAAEVAMRQAQIVIEGRRDGEPYVTVLTMSK